MLLQTLQNHITRIHPFYFEFQYIQSGVTVRALLTDVSSRAWCALVLSSPLSPSHNNVCEVPKGCPRFLNHSNQTFARKRFLGRGRGVELRIVYRWTPHHFSVEAGISNIRIEFKRFYKIFKQLYWTVCLRQVQENETTILTNVRVFDIMVRRRASESSGARAHKSHHEWGL